jgi:hypothetical protein
MATIYLLISENFFNDCLFLSQDLLKVAFPFQIPFSFHKNFYSMRAMACSGTLDVKIKQIFVYLLSKNEFACKG